MFAQATRYGNGLVTVLVRPNDGSRARLGLAVARRRIPGSVARNLFKRIIRERFRLHRARLGGYDIVVLPKAAAAAATRAQLRASIDRQWARIERHGADGGDNDRPRHGPE